MSHAPAPKLPTSSEARRLAALASFGIFDTEKEGPYEDIVRIAAYVCDAPISVVNLIDRDRQWFKAEVGLGVRETPLDTSICAHAILEQDLLVVPDTTKDSGFAFNPLVTGAPGLRFYAGALLKTADGLPLGTVCVLDTKPRVLSEGQLDTLRRLARQVMTQMELHRMVHQADQRVDRMARLVATAGHDLKSPLRGALYALLRIRDGATDAQVTRIESANADLADMDLQLNRLLAAVRVDAIGGEPELAPLPLQTVFDALAPAWGRTASRRGLSLIIEPTTATVKGDFLLLETVLGNFLSNAVKYTPRGGDVRMSARVNGDHIDIDVHDNGIGIAPEKVEQLFSAFRQADPEAEGLGLGLWLVRKSAAALHAEVTVLPADGGGTIFRLSLAGVVDQ